MEVTYQYHPCKNIAGKSYQLYFTDEKNYRSENTHLAEL